LAFARAENTPANSGQILAGVSWIQQVIQYLGVRRAKHLVVTPIHDLPNIRDRFWRAIDGQVDPTWRRYIAVEAVGASSPAAMNATDFRWRCGLPFRDHRSDYGSPLLVSIRTAAPKKSFRTRLPDRQPDISNASARRTAGCVHVPGCFQPNDPPFMRKRPVLAAAAAGPSRIALNRCRFGAAAVRCDEMARLTGLAGYGYRGP
jgi:hypothetical protein